MILFGSCIQQPCTPGTSAGRWLLRRSNTSLGYLPRSHLFSSLLLKLRSRPWAGDNSSTCLPSILSSCRTVGGRPQTLSPLPINGCRVLMTLGPADLDQTGMSQLEQEGKLVWHHPSSSAWVCPEPELRKQLMIWGQWQTITHRLASLGTEVRALHSSPALAALFG